MYIPSAKSTSSLVGLATMAVLLLFWVENSRVSVYADNYPEKLAAAKLMEKAEAAVKNRYQSKNILIDEINDPAKTGLIGDKNTLITTDRGNLEAKLTSLNPNFAAVVVDLLKKAEIGKGDKVAISSTGSFPALNIAVFSACKVLGVEPVVITSVSSSSFGATDPDFTWLDMETLFNQTGVFPYKSIAASLGGGRDIGRGMNIKGREQAEAAILRNGVKTVKNETLLGNIKEKMAIYKASAGTAPIKLYINIGGGLSSLGNAVNGKLTASGFHRTIPTKNVPLKGTMHLFAKEKVPVIHILDIEQLSNKYDLPSAPETMPKAGEGELFKTERYNLLITSISLALMAIFLVIVILFDHKQIKLREDEVNA